MACEGSISSVRGIQPLIGVLCCNEVLDRPVQTVATRFVRPLRDLSGAVVVLVPSVIDSGDTRVLAGRLDGLLLTGSRSHVAPDRYGRQADIAPLDRERDAVALTLADRMIERGRPVFGICRGMQEINVLFGGSLTAQLTPGLHHRGERPEDYDRLFGHRHPVTIHDAGRLSAWRYDTSPIEVTSVHLQGADRLGGGLTVEAIADDGLVEAISARPCGADVIGVQWHPECDVETSAFSRHFFRRLGVSMREAA